MPGLELVSMCRSRCIGKLSRDQCSTCGDIIVTALPVLVGYGFGRMVLGLNPAELMGGLAGAMTSGAALQIVTSEAKSPVPALGYTGAYAFANVILTIAGSLILLF